MPHRPNARVIEALRAVSVMAAISHAAYNRRYVRSLALIPYNTCNNKARDKACVKLACLYRVPQ